MLKKLLCAVALLCAYASAQTINPNQIRPGTQNGMVLETVTANQPPSWQQISASVLVNGSPVTNPNFNASAPSADSGYAPVTWKISSSSVLGEVPWIGSQVAGSPSNTTIQSAFTTASTTENVYIPQSYSGVDTYTNPNFVPYLDERTLFKDSETLQTTDVPWLMDESGYGGGTGYGSLARALTCAAAGSCTVEFVGNSRTEAGNAGYSGTDGTAGVANQDSWAFQTFRNLQRELPSVTLTGVDLGISGALLSNFNDATYVCNNPAGTNQFWRAGDGSGSFVWPNACTTSSSWKSYAAAQSPDIVFAEFGVNDCSYGASGYATQLANFVSFWQSQTKVPTIVLVVDPPQTIYTAGYTGCTVPLDAIAQVTREYARQNGILLVDAARLLHLYRDGYDIARDHFAYEASFNGNATYPTWPSGWTYLSYTGLSVGGTATVSGSTATISGTGAVLQRSRGANDLSAIAVFGGLTSSSVPTLTYRTDSSAHVGYIIQATYSAGAWTLALGYDNRGNSGTLRAITSAACAASVSTSLTVREFVQGAHHQAYCNSSNTATIDWYDYQSPGGLGKNGANYYYGVGIQATGGTVQLYAYPALPLQWLDLPIAENALFGQYNSADTGNGFYFAGPYPSTGGNGVNHFSVLGHDAILTMAAHGVLSELREVMGAASTAQVFGKSVTTQGAFTATGAIPNVMSASGVQAGSYGGFGGFGLSTQTGATDAKNIRCYESTSGGSGQGGFHCEFLNDAGSSSTDVFDIYRTGTAFYAAQLGPLLIGNTAPTGHYLRGNGTTYSDAAIQQSDLPATSPQTISTGSAAMTTAAISAGACGATVIVSAPGVASNDAIIWSFNGAPAGSNAGLVAWPTAGNVNFAYCGIAETPAAATINWRVVR